MSESTDAMMIREMTASPIEWNSVERTADAADLFNWVWFTTYQTYQADLEGTWIDDPYSGSRPDLSLASAEDLRAAIANFRERRPLAVAEYIRATRRFWALTAVTPEEHPKHFPASNVNFNQLCLQSRSGASLFIPGIGPGDLIEAYWMLIGILATHGYPETAQEQNDCRRYREAFWSRLSTHSVVRLVMDAHGPRGASAGHGAQHVCFELDASSPRLHAYPVTSHEAVEIRGELPVVRTSMLSGLSDMSQRTMALAALGTTQQNADR